MSMVQELISAVTMAERQIDDQIAKLNSYVSEIEGVTERVETNLAGSQQDYGEQMLQQLTQTKKQVNQTIEKLQVAKDKLIQVRIV